MCLHVCVVACASYATKQTFAQCRIFLEETLVARFIATFNKIKPQSQQLGLLYSFNCGTFEVTARYDFTSSQQPCFGTCKTRNTFRGSVRIFLVLVIPEFVNRGLRPPLETTERFSGGHEQRSLLDNSVVILHIPKQS